MVIDFYVLVEQVEDEVGFLCFFVVLVVDWEEDCCFVVVNLLKLFGFSLLGWENGSIGGFFDVVVIWGEDFCDGLLGYFRLENVWWCVVQLMLVGKFYE